MDKQLMIDRVDEINKTIQAVYNVTERLLETLRAERDLLQSNIDTLTYLETKHEQEKQYKL